MTTQLLNVPIGCVLDYAGASVPSGYLECDGSAVGRTAYPALFAAIGTAWGAGNGSTTFNVPNLNGRVTIGRGSRSVGNTGGSETRTLTVDEMPSHGHTVPKHSHGNTFSISSESAHTHGAASGFKFSEIKDVSGRSGAMQVATGSGRYAHVSNSGYADLTMQSSTGAGSSHKHGLTGGVSEKEAVNTENRGGGAAHSIMQPYAVVRKVIRAA